MNFFRKVPLKIRVIFFLSILIGLCSYLRVGSNYELLSYDLRFRLRPPRLTSGDVIIIEIGDDTIKNLSVWPVSRDFHASLTDILKKYGARAVVFDILFSEPAFEDAVFKESIKAGENVYLPLAFHLDQRQKDGYRPPLSNEILAGICEPFKKHLAGSGHINTFIDMDGKVRAVPLFIRYQDTFIPHLALQVSCDLLDYDISQVTFKRNLVDINGKLKLPVGRQTSFMVNYPGRWTDSFRHVSYFQILQAYADVNEGKTPQIELSQFRNKICLVGLTATGTHDIKPMSLEGNYPMLGVQASVVNSILTNQFIIPAGLFVNMLINLAVFLFVRFFCLRDAPLQSLLASIVTGCFYFAISLALFVCWGVWINLFLPLLIIGATYTGTTLYNFIDEVRKEQLLEKELDIARQIQQSFLPPPVEEFADLKVAAFMQPAKFVAGDLYDIISLSDTKMGILIGDVSGKGVSASLIMAQTISLFRVFARLSDDPAEVLTKLNAELSPEFKGRFVTALYLIFDVPNRLLHISSAGHTSILVYKAATDTVEEFLPDAGLPLGVLKEEKYKYFQRPLDRGDKFFVYTDGVTEARNKKGEEFGLDAFRKLLVKYKDEAPKRIVDDFVNAIFSFTKGCNQHDDITMILLKA